MTIPILKEPPDMGPAEWCCFCFTPTRMWTDISDRTPGQQVACCEMCAGQRQSDEVPSKARWFKEVSLRATSKRRAF